MFLKSGFQNTGDLKAGHEDGSDQRQTQRCESRHPTASRHICGEVIGVPQLHRELVSTFSTVWRLEGQAACCYNLAISLVTADLQ
jgi:hypothetical protein